MIKEKGVLIYTLGNVAVSENTLATQMYGEGDPVCSKRSQEFYDAFNSIYDVTGWACARWPGQKVYSKELGLEWKNKVRNFLLENARNGINFRFSIQMTGHPMMKQPHPYFIVTDFLPYSTDEELSELDFCDRYPISEKVGHEQSTAYKNAHGIICFSPLTKYAVKHYFGIEDKRLATICSGVVGHVDKDHVKTSEKLILWVGADAERKGAAEVFEAFKIIHAADPQYKLHMVGIDEKIEHEGVTVYPFLHGEDLKILDSLYERAKVFILPSKKECLGLVYLEAMAKKTPVIATARGGMAEIIRRCGGGKVVAPNDVSSIVSAFYDITRNEDTYQLYSERAYKFSIKNTTWDVFLDRAGDAISKWLEDDPKNIPRDYNVYEQED